MQYRSKRCGFLKEGHMTITEIVSANDLSTDFVEGLSVKDAERVIFDLLANTGRVKEQGKILIWDEFNQNPDLLVNRLLAKVIVGQFEQEWLAGKFPQNVAVLSIENSAAYFASDIAESCAKLAKMSRPPRIIRARKLPQGEQPSIAMGDHKFVVEVHPITANGGSRFLVASVEYGSFEDVDTIIVADDFKATSSTLNGGIELAIHIISPISRSNTLLFIPVAALGKPDQANKQKTNQGNNVIIEDTITALNVRFWLDEKSGIPMIQANGFDARPMKLASAQDFA